MELLETRDAVHGVDTAYLAQSPAEALFRQRRLALGVGLVALFLTPAVIWIDRATGAACDGFRLSVSHYYYEPVAGTVFVMALAFIGALLLAYRGENALDGLLSTAAGIAAAAVALLPTEGPGCTRLGPLDVRAATEAVIAPDGVIAANPLDFSTAGVDLAHLIAAGILMVTLIYFSAVIFTRVRPMDRAGGDPNGPLTPQKRLRNAIYIAAALAMVAGVALVFRPAGSTVLGIPSVVAGEGLAMLAFGISWLVKGRILGRWLGP